jgi:hypothetical protein
VEGGVEDGGDEAVELDGVVEAVPLEVGVVDPLAGAVVVAGDVVVDGELLPPLSCGPRIQTIRTVNRTIPTPVATAIVTSRRSRLGR